MYTVVMSLHQTIRDQARDALRAKETIRLETLRSLTAAFQNEIIMGKTQPDKDGFLPDDAALAIVKRAVKQHKDSIDQFKKGGRADLVAKEKQELAILESYLPQMMTREEIHVIARARIEKVKSDGTFDPKAGGKLTGMIMKELAGKADGADVKAVVDELLKG